MKKIKHWMFLLIETLVLMSRSLFWQMMHPNKFIVEIGGRLKGKSIKDGFGKITYINISEKSEDFKKQK